MNAIYSSTVRQKNKTAFAAGFLFMLISVAGTQAATVDFAGCFGKAQTTYDMENCAGAQQNRADAELNDTYRKLMAKITSEDRAVLKEARNAWEHYRDKQCIFNSLGSAGGTLHTMSLMQCRAYMAIDYNKRLKNQLDCKEGVITCGGQ
jgi:uncharacterized protein YecT (DUF1311 family)